MYSSIHIRNSNQTELSLQQPSRPSSESTASSSSPLATTPSTKKQSILRKLSTSSRRSLSTWLTHTQELPATQPNNNNNNNQHPNKIKFSPPTNSEHHAAPSAKHVIGKSMRNVARTVKRSLHQLDRPRSVTADQPQQQQQHPQQQDYPQQETHQRTTSIHPHTRPPPMHPSIRSRAVSTSEVYSNRAVPNPPAPRSYNPRAVPAPQDSRPSHQPTQHPNPLSRSLNQQPAPQPKPHPAPLSGSMNQQPAPKQVVYPSLPSPPRSPKRLQKKNRPQSVVEPLPSHPSSPVALASEDPSRLTWHAQTPISSLPLAASILAAPDPPPVDHSTFLAIIPGQTPAPVAPGLSVVPPPACLPVEAPLPTAKSTRVEPAHSRRVSLTSVGGDPHPENGTAGADDHDQDNGFTFIRSPSKRDPPSPAPTQSVHFSPGWTEIMHQSTTTTSSSSSIEPLEIQTTRPPLVSSTTTTSLVHSCVAERGSFPELGEMARVHGEQVEELDLGSKTPESPARSEMSRKRKVTSMTHEANNPAEPAPSVTAEIGEGERQHKVARGLDQPFSSSSAAGQPPVHHHHHHHGAAAAAGHPLSMITASLFPRPRKSSVSPKKDRKSSWPHKPAHLHHSKDPKSRPSSHSHSSSSSDLWNFSIVSTVFGVVLIAVVLIGSSNFSGINGGGKSWIGNWMKKIV